MVVDQVQHREWAGKLAHRFRNAAIMDAGRSSGSRLVDEAMRRVGGFGGSRMKLGVGDLESLLGLKRACEVEQNHGKRFHNSLGFGE